MKFNHELPQPGSGSLARPTLGEIAQEYSVDRASLVDQMMPIASGTGTFFDENIDLRDPEGSALTARILEIYDAVRPRRRKRGRKALAVRIRKLVANGLRGHFFRLPPAVLYFTKADAEQYKDKPTWMKHGALGDVVKALSDAGLVRAIKGKKMPWNSDKKSWASSYWITDDFIHMALDYGISTDSIERRMPVNGLVQLFAPKPGPEFKWYKGGLVYVRKGERINFSPTAETQEWTDTLEAINAFYRQQEIALGLSAAELELWLADRNAESGMKGAPYRLPELFSTDIYRVFNNGDADHPKFDEGGRLFGGWWMNIPESLRQAITINGEPTVEVDYKNCHPRMLYHERGLDGDGELYSISEISTYEAATGVRAATYRPCIKWLMQILINGRGRPEAVERPADMVFPPDISITKLVALIEARHEPIASSFRTGAGLRLMRLESDIALEIISSAMHEGFMVLSVHDSFITTNDKRDRLKTMMIDAYVRRLEKEPALKG
ncbi:hypothetical protein NUH86_14855 [Sphingobium sp. JS3065]|uniref:hypothetical protein n=1 Tax=Sphingobium sp. JS3065 TaxID=2970925 RepID=UPI002263F733|nr:hypothetical protein [Sphingobium sp. JS3065]UZW54748.1 hypothetical protein NUH86_14855 [Sphingobium sp. JS3065]